MFGRYLCTYRIWFKTTTEQLPNSLKICDPIFLNGGSDTPGGRGYDFCFRCQDSRIRRTTPGVNRNLKSKPVVERIPYFPPEECRPFSSATGGVPKERFTPPYIHPPPPNIYITFIPSVFQDNPRLVAAVCWLGLVFGR